MDTKALRQKILDLAIRGKLVPQDPNDEPASVLLERIRAKKQQMVKEGKLKPKDIQNDSIIYIGEDNLHYEKFQDGTVKCIEDEIPFEIPQGWEWTRLGNIAIIKGGKRIPKGMGFSDCKTNHIYIRVVDMKNNSVNLNNLKYISNEVFEYIRNYTVEKNDLYITIAGTIGEVGEIPEELDGMNLTENAAKITSIQANKSFLCLLLQSDFAKKQFNNKTYQVAMPKLGLERIHSVLIPICQIKTQQKIVVSVRKILNSIESINANKADIIKDIRLSKSKILDLAIRGKLVPQDPNDEPASVLLERIQQEKEELIKQGKIKLDKKESVIFKGEDNSYYEKIGEKVTCIDDEIPFEIPENWCWCRLSNFAEVVMGSSPKNQDICKDTCYTEFHQGKIYFSKEYINHSNQYTKSVIKLATKGSVLLCVRAPVGEVNITDRDICIGRGLSAISPYNAVKSRFLFYWLKAYKKEFISKSTGSTFSAITVDTVKNTLLPIPPLDEQQRIMQAIVDLYNFVECIETSLK